MVYVDQAKLEQRDRDALNANLEQARLAGAKVEVLEGEDVVDTLIRFARQQGITQIFAGHSKAGRNRWWERIRHNPLETLILEAEGIDVRVFPN